MSGNDKCRSFSESLVLDDSEKGVIITGIKDDTIAAKSGLQAGDEIVAATIHLDHLNKTEVMNILKVLEPYDDNMKVVTKKKNANAAFGSLGLDLKDPLKILNQDLPLDASAETPLVSLDGQSGQLNATQGLEGEISGPSLNGDLPTLSLNTPSADAGAKVSTPCLRLNGPDIKGDLDVQKPEIKTGGLKYNAPKFSMPNFSLPESKTSKGEMDIPVDLHSIDGKATTPKLDVKSPDLDLNESKVDVNCLNVNIENPDADIEAPPSKKWYQWKSAKGPETDLNTDLPAQTSGVDIDARSRKINWPWKKKSKKTELDLDGNLNTPDGDLCVQNVRGGINAPDVDVLKAEVPDQQTQNPNIDLEAPSSKSKWFTWKRKKTKEDPPDVNLTDAKTEGDINVPCAELNLQKSDLSNDAKHEKYTWPHQKLKKPKLFRVDMDHSTPDVDTSVPNVDVECSTPDVDFKATDADIEAHKLKKFPTLKRPKLFLSGPKMKEADLDTDVEAPDLSLSSPDVPCIDLNSLTADGQLKGPNAEIDGPSTKPKWFNFKKPKFGTVKAPKADLDADVKTPEMDLPALDVDLNAPDVSCTAPKIEGGNVKGPNMDLNVPDPDLDPPKLNFPKFKLPTMKSPNIKGPELDTDLKTPDIDASANVDLKAPKIEGGNNKVINPDFNVKGPNMDLNVPDPDLDPPKLNFPKFKLPTMKSPNIKGPELDTDLKTPDIDASANVDLKAPKIEGGNNKVINPDFNVKGPNMDLNVPDPDLDPPKLNFPKFKLPTMKSPNIKGPELDTDLKTPDIDASANVDPKAPKIEGGLDVGDLDIDGDLPDSGKFKLPKIKFPKFNLSESRIKGTNLDADAQLRSPDIDPGFPAVDVKGANLDLPTVDLPDLSPDQDFKLSSPKIDGKLSVPNIDTKLPNAELEAPDAPNMDINLPKLNIKGPDAEFKKDLEVEFPSISPSTESRIETPNINIGTPRTANANISSVPALDLSLPKAEGDIKGPEADLKVPNVDANTDKSKFLHFKLPKLNFSGSHVKSPGVDSDVDLEIPDVNAKAPSVEGELSSPHVKTSLNTAELDIKAEAEAAVKDSPRTKLRWPFKWGSKSASGADEEGSGVDSETDVPNIDEDVPAFKIHTLPRNSLDGLGGIGDTFGLSKLDKEAKDYVVSKGIRLPVVTTTSKMGEKIDIVERLKMAQEKVPSANASPTEAKTDINLKLAAPSLDVSASKETGDSSLVRGGTFKVEKPESSLGLVAPEISTSDENDKLSLGLHNMLGLNIKDSDAD